MKTKSMLTYLQMVFNFIFFFFSSRRRHTRFDCDWSSDVCSSDLRGLLCDLHAYGMRQLGVAGADPNDQVSVPLLHIRRQGRGPRPRWAGAPTASRPTAQGHRWRPGGRRGLLESSGVPAIGRITMRPIRRLAISCAALLLGLLPAVLAAQRSEEHTSELQSQSNLVCRLLLEKKKKKK